MFARIFITMAVILCSTGDLKSADNELDSADKIVFGIYGVAPTLPISPEMAVQVASFDTLKQTMFARAQVFNAARRVELLKRVGLSNLEILIKDLEGKKAEWQVVVGKYEFAENKRREELSRKIKKEQRHLDKELYFAKKRLLIEEMRAAGGYAIADEWEAELRHDELMENLRNEE